MSLNKVLNRPLFRKQALKKGALKPIKAANGEMIGPMPPNLRQRFTNTMSSGIGALKNFGKDALRTGPGGVAVYGGLEAIDPRLAAGVCAGELSLLGARFIPGAKQAVNRISRFTPFGMLSNMPFKRATGIGLATLAGGKMIQGFKNRNREREFVKEYAKRNNLDVDETLSLYERDLPGLTRGFSGLRTSDLAKATTIASQDFKTAATPFT